MWVEWGETRGAAFRLLRAGERLPACGGTPTDEDEVRVRVRVRVRPRVGRFDDEADGAMVTAHAEAMVLRRRSEGTSRT